MKKAISQTLKAYYPLIFIGLILFFLIWQFRWEGKSGDSWKNTIDGDGTGYFAYLEQIFINYNFGNAPLDHNQINDVNGHSLIKYTVGTSLLTSPFFAMACGISYLSDQTINVNNEYIQKSVSIAALFYLLAGMLIILRLLRNFGLRKWESLLIIFLFTFGTNLFTYVVINPSMSHVFSFFAISGFFNAAQQYGHTKQGKFAIYVFIWLGIVFLIRPFNILIGMSALFFFTNFKDFFETMRKTRKQVIIGLLIFIFIGSLQLLLNFLQCGKIFAPMYPNEGFYFSHPEIFNVLLGFRKGLFIYTPLLFIGFIGLYLLYKKSKFRFTIILLQLILIVYLISAWWCWTYSDGFGMRPFIDFYPLFIMLFAIILLERKKFLIYGIISFGLLCFSLNLIQQYQYYRQILPEEYMDLAKYKSIFLKTDIKYANCLGGCLDIPTYNNYNRKLIFEEKLIKSDAGQSKIHQVFDYSNKEFGLGITIKDNTLMLNAQKCYCEISFEKLDAVRSRVDETIIVLSIEYPSGTPGHYIAFPMEETYKYPTNTWHPHFYRCHIPKIIEPNHEIKCYIWNKGLFDFEIKSFSLKIYTTA